MSMPLLALSDDELSDLLPLALPVRRAEFLRSVADALAAHPAERGPGLVHRTGCELQRQFLTPPTTMNMVGARSKYR